MKAFWMILACAGGVIAVAFVFREDYDKAFVAAASSAVCWFLNYRHQLRESLANLDEASRDEENQHDEESDEEIRS